MAKIKSKAEQRSEAPAPTNGHAEAPVAQLAPPEAKPEAHAKPTKKTKCPISRDGFFQHANPALPMTLDGKSLLALRKQFSTGSFGWNTNEKVTLMVGGVPVTCQVGLNITVVNSKEAD